VTTSQEDKARDAAPQRRLRGREIPAEGDGGVFSETWFPVCLSSDVPARGVHGCDFLDGRVIVSRDRHGEVRVFSAYCLHVGADLSIGQVTDSGNIKCAFHGWEYDGGSGKCAHLPSGDPVPSRASLYRFPTVERYGIVFAFNGPEPRFSIPDFDRPEASLVLRSGTFPDRFSVDPWVICANTPDLLHVTELHQFEMRNDPYEDVTWQDYSATFPIHALTPAGPVLDIRPEIHGTNLFHQNGTVDGRWFGWSTWMGIPTPGQTTVFYTICAQPEPHETPEQTGEFLDYVLNLEMSIASEDVPIFAGMRYTPGNLTRGDRVLARFFEYLRTYPRSHASADFLN